ncbi:tetratricopeptide repeat protein [Aliarcobacter lanthieri]|uniref:tetratricopeptide repeat protein n=1 Tax=Aliarcobacter lanthieri TaxID=1355374 RepID=UPI003AAEE855
MKKILPLLLVISSLTVAEEVSVYGGAKSDSSYGLTSTEKHILKNQSNISDLSSKLDEVSSLVKSINGRLEGLESTYEGDSKKLNDLSLKLNQSSDLASNEPASNINESDLNNLKAAITKLTTLVNKINAEYVSSSELEKNMQQFVTREEFEAVKKAMGIKTPQSNPTNIKENKSDSVTTTDTTSGFGDLKTAEARAKLMSEAKKDFDSKLYTNAIPKFEKLVELNYKPAENNYYLGEMWFKRKKYDQSITYYKRSAILNDKASYMPSLLLNSGISFENIKDKENAKNFYSTLIELYPKSSEAKTAKANLSKL